MAYNPYQPMYYSQYQPQIQQAQQANNMIWIQGGLNTAKNYHVAPNESIPLWDQDEQVIYLKSADASGMPTIKILDYTIRETQPQIQNETSFATKSDLAELRVEISKLTETLNYRNQRRDSRKESQRNE